MSYFESCTQEDFRRLCTVLQNALLLGIRGQVHNWRSAGRNVAGRSALGCIFHVTLCILLFGTAQLDLTAGGVDDKTRGLPFIRSYPLDEIANIPNGLRLGFDAFGRVAVMYDGVYTVLNDSAWVERIGAGSQAGGAMTAIKYVNGAYYYGGRGTWGRVELRPDGHFSAASLVPENAPEWTTVTPFNKFLATSNGLFFYELNGLVFWDYSRNTNCFFPMPRLLTAFTVGSRVFVSCQDQQLREIQSDGQGNSILSGTGLEGETVIYAATLDASHALLAVKGGRLLRFDGQKAVPWSPQAEYCLEGRVTAMEHLPGDGVAIAVAGKGLYIFSKDGELTWCLELPEFQRIEAMAANEPGVLWLAGNNAVHRVLYDSPLTSFGQQLGLTAVWPHVVAWNSRVIACSNNYLYELMPTKPGRPYHCRVLAGTARRQADFVAASGPHLLAGNSQGVFSVDRDGSMSPVLQIENVAGLDFIAPDTCLVIGSGEIAALKFEEGKWTECASRIPGVGDSPIQIKKHNGLWLELGGARVAHLTFHDGVLEINRIVLPWNKAQWTNIGVVGKTVIFSGASGQRAYYDEVSLRFIQAPDLDKLLNRSPYWLLRITEDESGVLWATHAKGVVTFTPNGSDYIIDASTFELRNDSYPTVMLLPGRNIWIGTSRSLYHVENPSNWRAGGLRTLLVSLVANQRNTEQVLQPAHSPTPSRFSFDDGSLSFRFFSGTYSWRFPPQYQYRLGAAEEWTPVDPGLLLRLPKLRDGVYQLEVSQRGMNELGIPPITFAFEIKPPWFRTPLSYSIYALLLAGSLLVLARWMNAHSIKKNAALERLVSKRTSELEIAMEKLGEESKNAATLAERSRLAGEIHDSVQQGLSGAILLLDTAMVQQATTPKLLSQLNIIRNMVSYSREEVQQAVWNLGSPLLQNASLPEALRKLAGYINTGTIRLQVLVQDEPGDLAASIQHNLLRIAQEAITNAVKHSECNYIEVLLQSDTRGVTLSITDDGKGFDHSSSSQAKGHFGLRGLQFRAKAIGAELTITTAPGSGTRVRVVTPMTESNINEHRNEI